MSFRAHLSLRVRAAAVAAWAAACACMLVASALVLAPGAEAAAVEPSAGYVGPARTTVGAGAEVVAWELDARRAWVRDDLPAGAQVWTRPRDGDWSWAWREGDPAWHMIRRSLLRVETGRVDAGAAGARTTTKLDGPWHASGRYLRDASGRVVTIHGMNAVWKHAPYAPPEDRFGDVDAKLLADMGFNGVRLGVLWAGVEPKPNSYDAAYLRRMRTIVDQLTARDVTSLVDSHQDMYSEAYRGEGFPDWTRLDRGSKVSNVSNFPKNYVSPSTIGAFNDFWANRAQLWTRFRNQWIRVALEMRSSPGVIGYDIINEPWPGSSWARCVLPGGCRAFDRRLQAMQEHAVAGIRLADRTTPVWWEGSTITAFGGVNQVGRDRPLADPATNSVLSFHTYCALGGSLPWVSQDQDPTCASVHARNLRNAETASRRSGSAMALTEFGASDQLKDIARVADLADARMTSWYYWHYGMWGDPTSGDPKVHSFLADDATRAVKQAKADILVRTYPQAIAGTPVRWSFGQARDDRRFELVYDIDPRVEADTSISVPVRRHYEAGYTVQVTGPARVVSRPDAPLLELRGTGVPGRVTVRVVRVGHRFE